MGFDVQYEYHHCSFYIFQDIHFISFKHQTGVPVVNDIRTIFLAFYKYTLDNFLLVIVVTQIHLEHELEEV